MSRRRAGWWRAWLLAGLLLAVARPLAAAADLGTIYDDATLQAKAADYREVVQWNLDNVFLPQMSPAERRALAGLRLEFPLRGPTRSPFDFLAYAGPRVVLPLMSIKFLADISVAHAWLETNGYAAETVAEYLGMLKYQPATAGRPPDPRTALRIPADATDNPRVDQLSQQILNQALTFILLHELGHVVHAHPGYAPDVPRAAARENEAEADRFALEIMRRIGQPPTGIFFFFNAVAYFTPSRGDFASDDAHAAFMARDTHPIGAARIRAVAAFMRENAGDFAKLQTSVARATIAVRHIADQLEQIATFLADPGLQRLAAMRGRAATIEGLAPRRPGEVLAAPPRGTTGKTTTADSLAFHGVYDGKITDGTAELDVRFVLERSAARVTGRYSFGGGEGRLTGLVEGDGMTFAWRSGDGHGYGRLRLDASGGLAGSWGNGEEAAGGGTIVARRAQ
ncbi:MAG: hypothetical protein JNK67_18240 [Alphaproteobacteria bacterium]|nr:hypothetical protein [Alphaproteobacteria bacterium]